jgi:hypothetical protein
VPLLALLALLPIQTNVPIVRPGHCDEPGELWFRSDAADARCTLWWLLPNIVELVHCSLAVLELEDECGIRTSSHSARYCAP